MKKIGIQIIAAVIFLVNASYVSACPWCRAQVKTSVYAEDFIFNLCLLLLPVLILIAAGISLYFKNEIIERFKEKIKQWKVEGK